MEQEIAAIMGITRNDVGRVNIPYDKMEAFLLGPMDYPPYLLDITTWEGIEYTQIPQWTNVATIESCYVANAPEILRAPLRREHTYRFS